MVGLRWRLLRRLRRTASIPDVVDPFVESTVGELRKKDEIEKKLAERIIHRHTYSLPLTKREQGVETKETVTVEMWWSKENDLSYKYSIERLRKGGNTGRYVLCSAPPRRNSNNFSVTCMDMTGNP